jgi:hypothetical protein
MAPISSNPLQQYFRRPALYLRLPSGGSGYSENAIDLPENGEIPIYPMTAIDEITSRTPDALYNGIAIFEVIKSCAPNILDPWEIPVLDLDPILVAIRAATNGNLMEIETTCPSCSEEAKYDVNLAGILANFKPGDYNKPLEIGEDLIIKFKPLPYREVNQTSIMQFEIQKMLLNIESEEDANQKNEKTARALEVINNMTITLITKTIEYVKTPNATVFDPAYIDEFLRNIDAKTFESIKQVNVDLRQSTENKPLDIKCVHCSHEYQQEFTINASTFFG